MAWPDLLPLGLLLVPVGRLLWKSLDKPGPGCAALQGPLDVRFVNYLVEWGYLHLQGAAVPDGSLWSPPFFYPVPRILAYSENLFAAYPFYFPLRWLGLSPSEALFSFHLTQLALTPVVAYLCLRTLRLGRISAFVGAAVFAWGWVRYYHYGHLQFSAGYTIPLFFTALYFAFHRRRPWALVIAAWTFLFTWHFSLYTAVFLVLATLALGGVWLLIPGGVREMGTVVRWYGGYAKACPGSATAVVLLCLTAAGLVLPSALVYIDVQEGLSVGSEAELRLYWGDLFSWIRPPGAHPVLGGFTSWFPRPSGGVWEKIVFLGWLGLGILGLPLAGLLLKGRKIYAPWPRSLVAVSAAGASIILVFSSYGGTWLELPFLLLYRHFPGLSGMRAPTRIAFVVAWLVVLCMAVVLDRLLRRGLALRFLAVALGVVLLVENVAPLPRIVDRCEGEAIWGQTQQYLCSEIPGEEIGTLLFLPMNIDSIPRIIQQILAMQTAQRCDLNLVNGYTARRPPLIAPLLDSPADVFPCATAREVVDRVHRESGKGVLIHLDHGPPLGPAGYPPSEVRECFRPCLAPEPSWYVEQPGRPATVFVTNVEVPCASR